MDDFVLVPRERILRVEAAAHKVQSLAERLLALERVRNKTREGLAPLRRLETRTFAGQTQPSLIHPQTRATSSFVFRSLGCLEEVDNATLRRQFESQLKDLEKEIDATRAARKAAVAELLRLNPDLQTEVSPGMAALLLQSQGGVTAADFTTGWQQSGY